MLVYSWITVSDARQVFVGMDSKLMLDNPYFMGSNDYNNSRFVDLNLLFLAIDWRHWCVYDPSS